MSDTHRGLFTNPLFKISASEHFSNSSNKMATLSEKEKYKICTTCHRGSTSVAVIKFIIYQKSKVRDYCSFLGYLITVNYKVLALHTVNHFKSSKINIEFEI